MNSLAAYQCWNLDTDHSTLIFSIGHALHHRLRGQFLCWGGRILLDRHDPARSQVHVWVDLSSIDTGSRKRNEHILETELFDIRCEPALVFDGDHVELDPAGCAVVVGCLALHTHRKEIAVAIDTVQVRYAGTAAPRLAVTARASIDRATLGLRWRGGARDWLSDRLVAGIVDIKAEIEAVPTAPASDAPS